MTARLWVLAAKTTNSLSELLALVRRLSDAGYRLQVFGFITEPIDALDPRGAPETVINKMLDAAKGYCQVSSERTDLCAHPPQGTENIVHFYADEHGLSPRENQLLHLAVNAKNNKEAADLLGCAQTTVASLWQRIFKKTGCHSQRDVMGALVRYASRQL